MRIDSLDLICYGHFRGQKIDFPTIHPDYYIIYGDNEAGKSTLLRGISALLFGVPVKTPDVHSCKGSDLRIGATISESAPPRAFSRAAAAKHAAPALFAELNPPAAGCSRFSFRRRKGISGTLLNLNDGQLPEDSLSPFLRELDRGRFEQFFGLTHDRLREGGEELLRGQGDVGAALFQASGLLDLRRLLESLDADARELFSPKSRTRAISKMIEDYRLARQETRKLAISAPTVRQKQLEVDAAAQDLGKLKSESHTLQQELVRLRRIDSNKPDLARLQDLRIALAKLDSVPILPGDARRQRDDAAAELSHAGSRIETLTEDIAQREKRIQELPANSLIAAHEAEITDLNAGINDYIRSVSDRPKRLRELEEAVQRAEAAWKEVWSQPVDAAEELKPVYSGKEEIHKLAADYAGLTSELKTAENELASVNQEQERLREQLAQHPDLPDLAGLVAAIDHAKSLGDTDQSTARLRAEIERLGKKTSSEMRRLSGWQGTVEELEGLQTPLLSTIDRYAREWEAAAQARKEHSARLAACIELIRERDTEIGSLTAEIAELGEVRLAAVRARRDELWREIRASAFEKKSSRKAAEQQSDLSSLAEEFGEHQRKADEIADVRFANARDVVIHDRLAKEIASARAEQERLKNEMARLDESDQDLKDRWSGEWTALGSPAKPPLEMKEWVQARQSVLLQVEQSREKEDELAAQERHAAAAAAQISVYWAAFSKPPGVDSLPVMIKMAESLTRDLAGKKNDREDLLRRLKSLSVEKRQAKLDQCRLRLQEWRRKWTPFVSALLLPETSGPDQVVRVLAVLEKVFDHLKDSERLQHRVKRIGDNIDLFEKRVSQIVSSVNPFPDTPGLASDVAVKELHSRLVELGNAETARKELQEQNEKDRVALASSQAGAQNARTVLNRLRALAGCGGPDGERQLEAIIAAAEQKSEKQTEYERIASGLIERNAISDLGQIEQEAAAYDLDSLRSEIKSKALRAEAVVDEILTAAQRHGELTSEFERLETREESALQAQKAEDALARLRPAVAHYLRLRLASEVLQQAIESYREKHQGPILTRASELFARLTLDRYSGLTSDFGEDDKPMLVSIRSDGQRVHVDGLSDGARDQMYLSLRLAAIEHHVETVTPCPVIFDDLLINSDDARSVAALQVIAELAKRTQVLFFTHHRRLAELGGKVGAHVIELNRIVAVERNSA